MILNTPLKQASAILLSALALLASNLAGATDVSRSPLIPATLAKPNVIFGLDDSGSMDFEVMIGANDGALWWNDTTVVNGVTGTGWDSAGAPLFNTAGASGGDWTKLTYLFPNGCSASARILCDASGHYAIAPTAQFAWLRSSAYNPLYYNPATTYRAWSSAYIEGVTKTFTNSVSTAAPSHPRYATSTVDLTQTVALSTAADTVFRIQPGMIAPKGSQVWLTTTTTTTTLDKKGNPVPQTVTTTGWTPQTDDTRITVETRAAMAYFPATYWVPELCTVDNITCTRAPDTKTLKRYEVKLGNTFPSGRSYAAEMQNFANWYTFYRKRKLMLASSASVVLDSLTGMNLGVVAFNGRSPVTMYDTDAASASANAKSVLGAFYSNGASGGTPTRETLKYIGDQFTANANGSIIKYSCQKNAAFIMTDGFANATSITPPSYASATYGGKAPYTTTYAGTLADIALSYYTNSITSASLALGKVPAATPTTANPQNDGNPNLHVNTYAMTLGAKGTLWPTVSNAYTALPTWPNPSVDRSPTAVDDLWHATVNGRGQMFSASTPAETAEGISSALSNILSTSGSQSAVAFSTVNIKTGEALGYVGSYTPVGWSGDVSAYAVDPVTGVILTQQRKWSANAVLQARDYTTRAIATYTGSAGTSLDTASNWSALSSAGKIPGTVADFLAYLRGDRTQEGTGYRTRTGLIGAVVNAEPVSWLADNVVYATSNDGLLHAFDKTAGTELWAYAPSFVLGDMAAQSKVGTPFSTTLDGAPVVAKISATKTILVGGRGTAGTGYYALDVTNPRGTPAGAAAGTMTDALVAQRVMWEFPNATAPTNTATAMGASTAKPVIVKRGTDDWVALVTSGYNSTLDGKGRLYVLNAETGAWIATITTPSGTAGAGDSGLSQVSAWQEADGTVQYVYGGDLLGNVWKFDIKNATVARLATLTNAANATLPVTAAPELAAFSGKRMVFIGTGRLLGTTDFTNTATNSFFGLIDGTEINAGYVSTAPALNLRNFLAPRTITLLSDGTGKATGAAIGATQRGWYVELPAGEKANTDPTVGLGVVAWVTNSPSQTSCSSSSALYFADAKTGLQLPDAVFGSATPKYRVSYATTLTSRAVLTRLSSGKMVITSHQSNNTMDSQTLNLGGAPKRASLAWRQVLQ